MGTRKQCDIAIAKKNGLMLHEDGYGYWTTNLQAPPGHHWGDCHSRVVDWHKSPGNKAEYWDHVLEEIELLEATKCEDDPWCKKDHGFCEFWEDEDE